MSLLLAQDIRWTAQSIRRSRENGHREQVKSEMGYLSSLLSKMPERHKKDAINIINEELRTDAEMCKM